METYGLANSLCFQSLPAQTDRFVLTANWILNLLSPVPSSLSPRELPGNPSFLENQNNFPHWNAGFSLADPFLKIHKRDSKFRGNPFRRGRRRGSERGEKAGGASRVLEGREPSPENKQFYQRLCPGHVLSCLLWPGLAKRSQSYFSPEILSCWAALTPPASCLQPAACRLGLSCDFRNLIQGGAVSHLPRAATPAGPAPCKQRIQLGAGAAGLLRLAEGASVGDWNHMC